MNKKTALIWVDLQNDFCEGGGLAVPGGSEVISLANQLISYFDHIVATKDWHPKDHISFACNHPGKKTGDLITIQGREQILWPTHCVQESIGSEFHPLLNIRSINKIIYKGTDKMVDSYSTFFDNAHLRATGLSEYLFQHTINTIYIMGLATDYCVKYSGLDAAKLGFNTYVIEDACRGVELNKGDIAKAFSEMQEAGIKIINSTKIMK